MVTVYLFQQLHPMHKCMCSHFRFERGFFADLLCCFGAFFAGLTLDFLLAISYALLCSSYGSSPASTASSIFLGRNLTSQVDSAGGDTAPTLALTSGRYFLTSK